MLKKSKAFWNTAAARLSIHLTKLLFALACLGLAVLSYLWIAQNPLVTEIKSGPFKFGYVVNTRNLGDPDHVEIYIILQRGEADMTGPEGLLHYVEHLSIINALRNIGTAINPDSNAWTGARSVGYWISSPKAKFRENLKRLMGVFDSIALPEDVALKERNIILREFDVWSADKPEMPVDEALDRFLYSGNGTSRSTGGYPSEINSFTLEAAKKLHASTHQPTNAAIVVVGEISRTEVQAALRQQAEITGVADQRPAFHLAGPETRTFQFPDASKPQKLIWRRVAKLAEEVPYDVLDFRCKLLEAILRTHLPGGLAKPLQFDKFVAQSMEVSVRAIDEVHVELKFSARPDAGNNLSDLLSAFEKGLSDIATIGIPKDTFERVTMRLTKDMPVENEPRRLSEWTKDYVLERVSDQRRPIELGELRKILSGIELKHINGLLALLNSNGRTALAFIGEDSRN